MASAQSARISIFANLALALSLLGAAAMVYYHQELLIPRALAVRAANNLNAGYSFGNDLYEIWLTSRDRLERRRDPYSDEVTREIQIGLYGRPLDPHLSGDPKDRRAFPNPAFTDLLFLPAAELSFPAARTLFLFLLAASAAASVWLWMQVLHCRPGRRISTIVFLLVLTSYPVLEGLYALQIGLLVLFLFAASIFALQRGLLLLSGILMALTTIKPQITVLAILFLLIWSAHDLRRRGRFWVGLFVTGFALVASSLLVWPHWIQSWIHLLRAYREYNPPPLLGLLLNGVLGSAASAISAVLSACLLIAAILLAWRNRSAEGDSLDFTLTLSLLLNLTVIIVLPGQAIYDHAILLPGIFLIASQWRTLLSTPTRKVLLLIGGAALLWPWLAAFLLIVARPWMTPTQFYSNLVFALPLRTAVAFPFLVLALLAAVARRTRLVPL
jgi:hypothetical protein